MSPIKRSQGSPLPRRVWVCSILGVVWIVIAVGVSDLLVRQPLWQAAVDFVAVAATFAVLQWILGVEFSRTEKAQQAVRTSQEQLALVLEGSNDGFWDWNIVTREATYSPRWAEMLGYKLEEVPRHDDFWHDLIHPDDRARAQAAVQAHLAGRTPMYECELRLRTRSGDYKWILDRGKVVARDPDGRPLRAAGMHTDISERKRAEEALRQSEQKYRTLVTHMPQRLFIKDRNGVLLAVSDNLAADMGRRPEDIVGKTDADLWPPELAEKYRRLDLAVMASGALHEVEEPYEVKGEPRWRRMIKVPYHDAAGGVTGVLGMFSDITEHKLAEQALHASEERYRLLSETIPLLVWRTDAAGRVRECNRRWCEYTGQTPDEVRGDGWTRAVHPDDLPRVEERMREAADGAQTYEAQYRLRRAADGSYRWHLARALPMRDEHGRVTDWFGCATDIHDQREAEAARRASEERYRTLLGAVTDALFVHELNADGSPGRFVEVNDVACERLGYSRQELLGKTPLDLGPPEAANETAWMAQQLQDGLTRQFERMHVAKNGQRIPVEIRARRFTLQGRHAVMSLVRDITERKRAEEALRASEARLIEALEIARLGQWEYDLATGQITTCDQGFALVQTTAQRQGGYTLPAADFLRQFLHPDDGPLMAAHVKKAVADPDYQAQEEVRLIRRDGQVRWCLVRLKAQKSAESHTVRLRGSAQDITERKQAEQELQRQNAFRSAIVQHAAEGICVFHEIPEPAALVFSVWNVRMTQITGYTVEEINQRGWYPTLYPDPALQARARQRMQAMRDGQDLVDEEWEITRADGEKRTVSLSTSRLPRTDGPSQVLAVIKDITERKRDEIRLRLQHSALEAAANGIQIADRNGKILWVNDAFTTLTGYSRWEVVERDSRLLKSGKHDAEFYRRMWETILAGNVWRGELVNRRKDGSTYHEEMTITPVRDAAGGIAHFIAIKQDVSARRRFEQRLQEQARLLDLAQDAIFVRDLQDRIQYWNAGAERLYGWTVLEALHRPSAAFLYKDAAAADAAKTALLTHGHWEGELQQSRKDGTPITVDCRWTMVRQDDGTPQAVLAIETDITDRKRLEAQVSRGQRMESIGNLASGMAHDLNNILTPILMAAQMLKPDATDERKRKLIEQVENSAKRAAEMLRGLLTFTKSMAGERVAVEPGRVVRDVVKIIGETIPKNITIERPAPGAVRPVLGDPAQINQVVLNLCVNARDAMPNGGLLRLEVADQTVDAEWTKANLGPRPGRLVVPPARPGEFVVLTVADTGVGISPEDLEHICEPFFTKKEKGTGLGLAGVHTIVKTHGGFLVVESKVGGEDHGSTFRVFLPAGRQLTPPSAAKLRAPAHGQGEWILLVDDEEPVRAIAKATLEKHGYRVVTAGDGREGLDMFARQPQRFAAAIIDVLMPTMDGLTFLDALHRLRAQLKVMVMTGWATEDQEASFRNFGVRHFLRKPFTTEELLHTLRDLIEEAPVEEPVARA